MFQAHSHKITHTVVRERVVHYSAITSGLDQVQSSEESQLMRNGGYIHSQNRRKVANAHISPSHATEDFQTARVAHDHEDA
ncbi:MAG TPA: hypothetical protein VEZ43_02465 [Dongiaceae bacterium]|nr:hypothetical protein [Dongiaceae bacterium]